MFCKYTNDNLLPSIFADFPKGEVRIDLGLPSALLLRQRCLLPNIGAWVPLVEWISP